MYISKDEAGRLHAGAILCEDKGDTRAEDAEMDIAIAHSLELFDKAVIDYLKDDENK